jgi:5-methylcytosine-specific restriction protein A
MPSRPRVHNPFPKVVRQHQARDVDRRETERHAERFSAHARGYNREWRKVSRAFLQAHPLCTGFDSLCEERGKRTPSTEVDHVVPHRGNMRLFWDQDNWQALCHTCHSRKTALEDGGFGRPVARMRERLSIRRGRTIKGTATQVPVRKALVDAERARKILI